MMRSLVALAVALAAALAVVAACGGGASQPAPIKATPAVTAAPAGSSPAGSMDPYDYGY